MPIHINCPVCGQRLRVPNFAAGRITKCNACGNAVRVPQPKKLLDDDEESDEAKKAAGEKPAEPFSLSETWHRSIERLSGSLDWLAERPIRILFVALVLVGCYVGVATAKWALSKPPEGPIVSVEPPDLEPWEGVGMSDSNDRVRVTAEAVTTEQIYVLAPTRNAPQKTPNAYLKIALKIENRTPAELKFTGWASEGGADDHPAKLKDDTGGIHKLVNWKARIIGQLGSATIKPGGSVVEVLVFEVPGTYIKYLKLALPAEAVGGTGDLRLKLPRTRVLD
jgi:hypothetical protein